MDVWIVVIILVVLAIVVASLLRSDKLPGAQSVTRTSVPDSRGEQAAPQAEPTRIYVEILSCDLSPTGHQSWCSLLNMKLGDAKGARDLVLMEKRKNPNEDVEALIKRAIERWHSDINR